MLNPELARLARDLGRDAARVRRAGGRPTPCPWDADAGSIVQAQLAHQWSAGFAAEYGTPTPLPA